MTPISHPRSLVVLLLLVLAFPVHGCRSPDENRARQQQTSAPHHPAVASPSTPSAAARLMDGMGNVDFAITTSSRDAQAFFNQGVAQLYGFWFIEAERSFVQAAKLDPNAAMAYWGIAMAAPGTFLPMYQLVLTPNPGAPVASPNSPESRARAAIAKAQALRDSITPRERLYIEAVAARHNPALRDPDAAYIAVMRRLVESFPDDLEGSKDLRGALPVANSYAGLAPNIPHVLHMPGHLYAQIGMFDEAVKAFLAAAAKEREYMSADPRYSKLSYVHNEILLLHVLGSQGRYRDAMSRIADLMSAKENLADRDSG